MVHGISSRHTPRRLAKTGTKVAHSVTATTASTTIAAAAAAVTATTTVVARMSIVPGCSGQHCPCQASREDHVNSDVAEKLMVNQDDRGECGQ